LAVGGSFAGRFDAWPTAVASGDGSGVQSGTLARWTDWPCPTAVEAYPDEGGAQTGGRSHSVAAVVGPTAVPRATGRRNQRRHPFIGPSPSCNVNLSMVARLSRPGSPLDRATHRNHGNLGTGGDGS
jgi:hypothetical protein